MLTEGLSNVGTNYKANVKPNTKYRYIVVAWRPADTEAVLDCNCSELHFSKNKNNNNNNTAQVTIIFLSNSHNDLIGDFQVAFCLFQSLS